MVAGIQTSRHEATPITREEARTAWGGWLRHLQEAEATVDARVRALSVSDGEARLGATRVPQPEGALGARLSAPQVLSLLGLWPAHERARAWCIIGLESSWRPWEVNEQGCAGLFQLCPEWHYERLEKYGGWEMVLVPEVNARVAHAIWEDWGNWGAWRQTAWRCE